MDDYFHLHAGTGDPSPFPTDDYALMTVAMVTTPSRFELKWPHGQYAARMNELARLTSCFVLENA